MTTIHSPSTSPSAAKRAFRRSDRTPASGRRGNGERVAYRRLRPALFRAGWRPVNETNTGGLFTLALWGSPDGKKILKVSRRAPQDNWPMFALWAATQTSENLPRYDSVRVGRYLCVAVMERLLLPRDGIKSTAYDAGCRVRAYAEHLVFGNADKVPSRERPNTSAQKALQAIYAAFGSINDLHAGNVLFRKQGARQVPVIADPFTRVKRLPAVCAL